MNFPRKRRRSVFWREANGSGKTTLLSHLQPFASSNDVRKRALRADKEGRKMLIVVHKNDTYEIEHIYRPNTKSTGAPHTVASYFKVNGEEKNSNGGLRTFEALLEEHLDITKDFFTVGRIGTNVGNFVDLGPTGQKEVHRQVHAEHRCLA